MEFGTKRGLCQLELCFHFLQLQWKRLSRWKDNNIQDVFTRHLADIDPAWPIMLGRTC